MIEAASCVIALHYQNENCHPAGKIKIGIAGDSAWRDARLAAARRLFDGARATGVPILHVRLAVPPDYRGVRANTPLIRQWIELGAWQEGSWGVEFLDALAPAPSEQVITHTRNSAFHRTNLAEILEWLEVRHVLCCGVSTAYAVEGTVREAADYGYDITVAADACSTASEAQHQASLTAMAQLARIRDVDDILEGWRKPTDRPRSA